uniref:Uncharacterized protein n=1 Tax=Peronospora matthiolae TaxID=2874970 RepID=A0AAV1TK10_9STRA
MEGDFDCVPVWSDEGEGVLGAVPEGVKMEGDF